MTSYPNEQAAQALARLLVQKKIAACAQVMRAGMMSIYEWQGSIESSEEILVSIKTFDAHFEEIEKVIKEHHTYEVPEIIAISIEHMSKDYLDWMKSEIGA